MTRKDIIRMARETGMSFTELFGGQNFQLLGWLSDLERFAALIAAAEREECAKVCDWMPDGSGHYGNCAAAIRARGEK